MAAPQLDAVFDALASSSRREIVTRLARGAMTTTQIGRHFAFSKQALSRHIALLEEAGLIARTTTYGRVHELSLVPQPLDRVAQWVHHLRRGWTASLDRLDDVLRGNDA
jgi:DNA-binding transcriptional ArsR family regulator